CDLGFPSNFLHSGGQVQMPPRVRLDPRDVQLPAQYFPRGLQCHRRLFPVRQPHAVHLAESVRALPATGEHRLGGSIASTSLATFLTELEPIPACWATES